MVTHASTLGSSPNTPRSPRSALFRPRGREAAAASPAPAPPVPPHRSPTRPACRARRPSPRPWLASRRPRPRGRLPACGTFDFSFIGSDRITEQGFREPQREPERPMSHNLDDVPEHEVFPGVRGRFVHCAQMTFAYWRFDPGAAVPEHEHPHEQVVNMLEGELALTVARRGDAPSTRRRRGDPRRHPPRRPRPRRRLPRPRRLQPGPRDLPVRPGLKGRRTVNDSSDSRNHTYRFHTVSILTPYRGNRRKPLPAASIFPARTPTPQSLTPP